MPTWLENPTEGWVRNEGPKLSKEIHFRDFRSALSFVNEIGELAEAMDHHPEIILSYGRVKVILWTHTTGGLTEKDEHLARAIDRINPVL